MTRILVRLALGFEAALWGLVGNRLRSLITILGVAIGVASIVSLVSIGEGARLAVVRQFESLGTNVIQVESHHWLARLSVEDAVDLEQRVPTISAATPVVKATARIKWRREVLNGVPLLGVDEEFPYIRDHDVVAGRFFSHLHVKERLRVCVLGYSLASSLFGGRNPVGQYLYIGEQRFKVIGVLERRGRGMAEGIDDTVVVPVTAAQRLTGSYVVNAIWVKAKSREAVDPALVQIGRIFRKKFRIGEGLEPEGQAPYKGYYRPGPWYAQGVQMELPGGTGPVLTVTSLNDLVRQADEANRVMILMLGAIAGVSLLVGGLGIMNIMLVSVSERTREIGLRKALGATRLDLLYQFLVEAMVLSIIGTAIGLFLGYASAEAVARYGLETVVTARASYAAVLAALGVGVLFGVYPAYVASGLSPVEALRRA